MTDLLYHPFYLRGQQDARAAVAAWPCSGLSSYEEYCQYVTGEWTGLLANARAQVAVTTGDLQEAWKQHRAYFEGALSVLAGEQ